MAEKLLNDKQVQNIKPEKREMIYRDGGGLELRVYPSGGKIWQLRYQCDGKRRIMRVGEYPHVSLKDARKKADKAHEQLDSGVDPQVYAEEQERAKQEAARIAKMEQAARKTFADVFAEWDVAKLSKRKDGPDLLRAMQKDVIPKVGDIEIAKVTRADLLVCLDTVSARAPRMANRLLTTLKTFYKWAQLREIVSVDPLAPVQAADVGGKLESRDRVLADDEIVDLIRKLPVSGLSVSVQAVLLIVLSTGCRLGEICSAEWAHVNGNVWTIPAENAKNKKEHRITLSGFALAQFSVLQEIREGVWCVPSPKKIGDHQTRLSIGTAIYDRQTQKAQRQGRTAATDALTLNGGRWTAHDLRRTCASGMQELGIMPAVIDAVLNHKESKGVTKIYQRYDYSKEAADAWAKWGRHLAGLRATATGDNVVMITG
ncbi:MULTISPECIES: tyrosine-type recombinase/integrase [Acidithiobacillus]|uniref:Integrase n=3 Tax=Acidithiobacillus thiooxidans TaxID=930 RepID=A0A5P9XT11_ACITH|nr:MULTISPECIES: site-specific integrase [Acidithiobacillus]MBU2835202.1 integrase arm-type DNA-binding domain-containing protein [Acidithiobacillus thiooxidans]MDA8177460.1 integrase arm-type DNA-binding domain-containing protein [Acidithiobacillus sp.]QFX97181.1 hypothetical protein GCD22_03068 [Acidithiobacillus thiooxidans ATCC 19377]